MLSDAGNGRLNLGLEPYTVSETVLPFLCGTVGTGLGPCARPSDGKVIPEYVTEDLCMQLDLEYDICALPRKKNFMVSFSMGGSRQVGNNAPLAPDNEYGYKWQVDKYLDLYEESSCYAIPEKDLFMYTGVGANDLFALWDLFLDVAPVDPVLYFQSYKAQVLQNITNLYSLGKARRMYVQLIDALTITQLPIFSKVECVLGNLMDDIMTAYDNAQEELQQELEAFAQLQSHFDLTVLTTATTIEEVTNNSDLYGIVNNGQTMLDLGWFEKLFENQLWFDDSHPSSHTHRVLANYVKTWFQQKICDDDRSDCSDSEEH